jgi:hypothetical protein
MAQLTGAQQVGRLLICSVACVLVIWGMRLLPEAYQPSRPLYMLAWLIVAVIAYVALRRRSDYLRAVATMLSVIFGIGFVIALFMRN